METTTSAAEDQPNFQMRRHQEPDQPSLFPVEDLLIPSSLQSFRKSVSAIHAVPLKGDRSLNIMRLMDACIIVAQLDLRNRDRAQVERIRSERITPLFEVKTAELVRLANIPGKNYQRIYEALDAIFEMVWLWNIVGEDHDVQWEMKSHFFAELGYGLGYKKGCVRFSFPPAILEFILEPKHWATMSLNVLAKLGKEQAYALYQNTFRYVNTNAKVTASLETVDWIRLICGSKTNYIKEDGDGKVTVNYGDFKRRTLLPMMEEVNGLEALSQMIELHEYRKGNRVARLQFKFVDKPLSAKTQMSLPLGWPTDVLTALGSIGYTQGGIQSLSEAYSLAEISDALLRLPSAQKRLKEKGITMTSVKSYFEGILRNISDGAGANGEEIDPVKLQAEVQKQAAENAAIERQQKLSEEFSLYLNARFVEWLVELDDANRQSLFNSYLETSTGQVMRPQRSGWNKPNSFFSGGLRKWMQAERPSILAEALSRPEDQSLEAWMAWRLAGGQ